jgi:hypothetical protein
MALQKKFGPRKVKTSWIGSAKWIGLAFLHMMLRLVKGTAKPNTSY